MEIHIPVGIHIPFEECEVCKNKNTCPNAFCKITKELNERRKEMVRYLRNIGIKTYTYPTPVDMFDNFRIQLLTLEGSDGKKGYTIYAQPNIVIVLKTGSDYEFYQIYSRDEEKWYKEMREKQVITPIVNFFYEDKKLKFEDTGYHR